MNRLATECRSRPELSSEDVRVYVDAGDDRGQCQNPKRVSRLSFDVLLRRNNRRLGPFKHAEMILELLVGVSELFDRGDVWVFRKHIAHRTAFAYAYWSSGVL